MLAFFLRFLHASSRRLPAVSSARPSNSHPLAVGALRSGIDIPVAGHQVDAPARCREALEVFAQDRVAQRERLDESALDVIELVDDGTLVVHRQQTPIGRHRQR